MRALKTRRFPRIVAASREATKRLAIYSKRSPRGDDLGIALGMAHRHQPFGRLPRFGIRRSSGMRLQPGGPNTGGNNSGKRVHYLGVIAS